MTTSPRAPGRTAASARRVVCVFSSLALVVCACGSSTPHRDASIDVAPVLDAPRAPPVLVTARMPDATDPVLPASPRPADMSCVGERTFPAVAPPFITLVNFATLRPAAGLCARIYHGDAALADTCAATDPRSRDDGVLTFVPGVAPTHLRVFSLRGTAAFDSYPDTFFHDVTSDGPIVLMTTDAVLNELALIAAIERDPAAATVAALFRDCSNRPVYGATVRLLRQDGTPIDTRSDHTRAVYGDGGMHPNAAQPWTHLDGLFGVVNVDVLAPGETVFIEMIGRRLLRDEPSIVACEAVQIFSGSVSTPTHFLPLRADGPTCPPL